MSGFLTGRPPTASAGVAGLVPSTGITGALVASDAAIARSKLAVGGAPVATGAAPAEEAATVASAAEDRVVILSATLAPSAVDAADCAVAVETGVGTGVYVYTPGLYRGAGLSGVVLPYSFPLAAGCRWFWRDDSAGTATAIVNFWAHGAS